MQIVIEIPKKLYDRYKEKDHIKRCDIDEFEKALDRGVILPKGHGDLIDKNEVCKLEENLCACECGCCALEGCFYDRAKTIIEADRSEE